MDNILEEFEYKGTNYVLTGLAGQDGDADYALALCDESGNIVALFKDGHIITQKFNSENLDPSPFGIIKTVDKNGNGDYTTIQSAVNGTANGDTILIFPGVYEEAVEMFGKDRHLVGVCKDTCILINGTGDYLTPPLEANIGSVENLTIIADNYAPTVPDPSENQNNAAYGIHIEYSNDTPYTFRISNCKIVSKWSAGLGIGLRYNQTIIIENSELVSECVRIWSTYTSQWVEMGGLFFHNDALSGLEGTGKLVVTNTILRGKKACLVMESLDNRPSMVDAEFLNSTLVSTDYGVGQSVIYRYPGTVTPTGYLCGSKITLAISSHGNNNDELNYTT
jgi:hypothetical protein